ncbi:hypothetical protein AXE80_12125 [Wenyingzhuangia fucanilytica]|uniref:Uncharacterized protein n=1 Tax=Wenyingzhuangia fucanilytica TaxID=1790137 RepID=A0A1B1Y877_9FLAO|nr:hypothetical protein [Wenyingzhuangia fucanilytica]ANW96980.1 hypothetical protein AXE80_12125 [Wenyingzhuangia fucanilytica]
MINELLKVLSEQQKIGSQKGYLKGIFASQRFHSFIPYSREDENIFFSSAIVFTLKEYYPLLSSNSKLIADNITEQVINCYPNFKNFKGKKTYNFFKTNPMEYFPNGVIMQHFKFFKLADDADDTVYIYLTDTKKKKHEWLKEKLIKHANGTLQWNFHKRTQYKNLRTYGVYFGKNMPIEIDACVLTNILLWSYKNKLEVCKQDKDSINYILKTVTSKDYINYPYLVSPCYPSTAQICYHYSRLVKKTDNNNVLSILRIIMIDDIKNILKKPLPFIDELLYHISLLNLDIKPQRKLRYQLHEVLKKTDYFYTSIPLMIPKLWVRKLQKHKLIQCFGLRTKCDGYTTALLLEYEILWKQST